MPDLQKTITLPDGRTLMYAEWGDLSGPPVILLHGTPGSRLNRPPNEAKVAGVGVRLITYDRAGYGGSSRHRGRRVVDVVSDVEALADALGLDQFAVIGGSGGGPHALAVAALLSDRITRAECFVGVAPVDVLGDAWMDGMDPENIKEFGWAQQGEEFLEVKLAEEQAAMEARVSVDPTTILGDFDLPEADREILSRPEVQALIKEFTFEMCRNGVWGWVDDDLAILQPWGFGPATITVPTMVKWGSEDVLVPPSHGEWIARTVPTAIPLLDTGGGHQSDPDTDSLKELRWLAFETPLDDPLPSD